MFVPTLKTNLIFKSNLRVPASAMTKFNYLRAERKRKKALLSGTHFGAEFSI